MGTHPIFESDFDCLTDMSSVLSHGQLTVPKDLPAALESLARAVLKEQPTDLPKFAAAHFRVLLAQRAESGKDPFNESAFFNTETVPPKFTDPLPESQREPVKQDEDMGSGASRNSSRSHSPKKEETAPTIESETVETPSEPTTVQATAEEQEVTEEATEVTETTEATEEATDAPEDVTEATEATETTEATEDMTTEMTETGDLTTSEDVTAGPDTDADKTEPTSEATANTEGPDDDIDIDLNDPDVNDAAVKIQAAFRGHKVRRNTSEQLVTEDTPASEATPVTEEAHSLTESAIAVEDTPVESEPTAETAVEEATPAETVEAEPAAEAVAEETAEVEAPAETVETKEEEIDIDLNDPSVEESAVKIQAAFRGHQVR